MNVLAGDIGGTNTRLVFAEIIGNDRIILAEKSYPSQKYKALLQVIEIFLSESNINKPVNAACIAVAGPVKSGMAEVTNLPWVISEEQLSEMLQTPHVTLINDFVAVSYGISGLLDSDILVLQQGLKNNNEPLNQDAAVIGAGTGLGASHLVWQEDHYQPFSSEAGHSGFAPENEQQCDLLAWLLKQQPYVSLEMLLSGKGIVTIYQYFRAVTDIPESINIKNEMQHSDPAQIITKYALLDGDELCQKTLECFIDIYASAASNIALHYYPVSEVFIAGGIAGKIKDKLLSQRFIKSFVNKGAMSSNMKKLTIKLILQEKVGLYGALTKASMLFLKH